MSHEHLKHVPGVVKGIGDVSGVGAVVVAWLDIINPLLDVGIVILTAIWIGYRIKESKLNIKARREKKK